MGAFRLQQPRPPRKPGHLLVFADECLSAEPDLIVFPEFATTGKPYAYSVACADLIIHATVSNDRRDICPVRCLENAIPMVISIYDTASYALDAQGRVIADLGETDAGGYIVTEIDISRQMTAKYGIYRDLREMYRYRRNPAAYDALTDPDTVLGLDAIMCDDDGAPLDEEALRRAFPRYDPHASTE